MDPRLHTFLTLCQSMNYRQTAQLLHLTQPAVTRQIQALEQSLGVKLFHYDGRRLSKTASCAILEQYAVSQRYQYEELTAALRGVEKLHLRVGATKTIGDYVVAPMVGRYLQDGEHSLSLTVDNTQRLLQLLEQNELDFAMVEGFFDRNRYGYRLFRQEEFTGICPSNHPFAGRRVGLEELFAHTLLVREQGSGTRSIFEEELADQGYTIDAFSRVVSISSFSLIKRLILQGMGVTFAYRAITRGDIRFAYFTLGEGPSLHEFNFVYLRHTSAGGYVDQFSAPEN